MKIKNVYSITKFTTTDYPNHLSCIVWFIKCNMRCIYCYNSNIVLSKNGNYSFEDVIAFLEKRKNLLEAVVLSGGEATLYNLELYCQEIKKMGFKIKLDTNGSNPNLIKKLVEKKLIDYIALDYKAPKNKFYKITESTLYEKFNKTLEYLTKIDFDFEIRTTYHSLLLNNEDLENMIASVRKLGYKNDYFIQNFLKTCSNLGSITQTSSNLIIEEFSQNKDIVLRNF